MYLRYFKRGVIRMNAIVSVDKKWGIGYQNDLLFHVPEDMRYFKDMTTGKAVVMGKQTFYSLPNQRPLTGRSNIILPNDKGLQINGATVCHGLDELLVLLEVIKTDNIFVIGGQAVYELMLPYCSIAYVTQFYTIAAADKHFPNLANNAEWELIERPKPAVSQGLTFTFDKYVRIKAPEGISL